MGLHTAKAMAVIKATEPLPNQDSTGAAHLATAKAVAAGVVPEAARPTDCSYLVNCHAF